MTATSGNRWGADLTMNMLTTVIDHIVWGAVASTQALNLPFGVTITAQNVTNGPATSFTGPVALERLRERSRVFQHGHREPKPELLAVWF